MAEGEVGEPNKIPYDGADYVIIKAFLDLDSILCLIVLFILSDQLTIFCFQSMNLNGCFDAIIN